MLQGANANEPTTQNLLVEIVRMKDRLETMQRAAEKAEERAEKAEQRINSAIFWRFFGLGSLNIFVVLAIFYYFSHMLPQWAESFVKPAVDVSVKQFVEKNDWTPAIEKAVTAHADQAITPQKIAAAIKPELIESLLRDRAKQVLEKYDLAPLIDRSVSAHVEKAVTPQKVADAIKPEHIATAVKGITSQESFLNQPNLRKLVRDEISKLGDLDALVKKAAQEEMQALVKKLEETVKKSVVGVQVKDEDIRKLVDKYLQDHPEILAGPTEKTIAAAVATRLEKVLADAKLFEDKIQAAIQANRESVVKAAAAVAEVKVDSFKEFFKEKLSKLDPDHLKTLELYPIQGEPLHFHIDLSQSKGEHSYALYYYGYRASKEATRKLIERWLGFLPSDHDLLDLEIKTGTREEATLAAAEALEKILTDRLGLKAPVSLRYKLK